MEESTQAKASLFIGFLFILVSAACPAEDSERPTQRDGTVIDTSRDVTTEFGPGDVDAITQDAVTDAEDDAVSQDLARDLGAQEIDSDSDVGVEDILTEVAVVDSGDVADGGDGHTATDIPTEEVPGTSPVGEASVC